MSDPSALGFEETVDRFNLIKFRRRSAIEKEVLPFYSRLSQVGEAVGREDVGGGEVGVGVVRRGGADHIGQIA